MTRHGQALIMIVALAFLLVALGWSAFAWGDVLATLDGGAGKETVEIGL